MNNKRIVKSLQTKLRMFMNDKKLTYEKLAEETDMSVDTIKSFFRKDNTSIPSYETLSKLAVTFGVSPDYLTGFFSEDEEAIIYLKHLLIAAKKLGLEFISDDDSLCIKCNDPKLIELLKTAKDNEDCELDKYARIMFFHGKVISEADFWEIKKKFYLYGELIELEGDEVFIDEYLSALDDAIRCNEEIPDLTEKLEEWGKKAGHPHLFISDAYYDVIYRDYEPQKPKEGE